MGALNYNLTSLTGECYFSCAPLHSLIAPVFSSACVGFSSIEVFFSPNAVS
jgi:hypothetical protein